MRLNGLHKRLMKTLCIIWLISTMLLVTLYFVLIAPNSQKLCKLQQTLDEKQAQLDGVESFQGITKKQKICKKMESLHSQLIKYAICQDDWIQAMPYISTLAEEVGVRNFSSKDISDSKTIKIVDCQYVGKRNLEVSFEASFPVFAKFMSKLETGSPAVFVDKFGISKAFGANEKPTVKMNLSILTSKFKLCPELFADGGGIK